MATRFPPFLVLALLAASPLPAQICADVPGDNRLIGFTLFPNDTVPAAANAAQWLHGSARGYRACMSAAMVRYSECLRGIFPPRTPLSPSLFD